MSETSEGEDFVGIPSSFKTRGEIEKSTNVGCFFCAEIFPAAEIAEWVDGEQTPVCPKCGIDSVIGDAQGVVLTKEVLRLMQKRSFEH